MKTALTAILLFAATAVAGYSRPAQLENVQWTLVEADGREVTLAMAYIQFEGNGRFSGSTGCNQIFGSVDVKPRRIDFSAVGSTKRMCKMMAGSVSEPVFLKGLEEARTYTQEGNKLVLFDRKGRRLLTFRRPVKLPPVEEPGGAASLESRKWVLESIGGRKIAAAAKGAFINFDATKGSAGGDSSCNAFGGEYTTKGQAIKIIEIISTMRACVEDARMSVERAFFDGLRAADRYEVKAGRLTLYRGPRALLVFIGERK
jgi:heat shock protein HslJ